MLHPKFPNKLCQPRAWLILLVVLCFLCFPCFLTCLTFMLVSTSFLSCTCTGWVCERTHCGWMISGQFLAKILSNSFVSWLVPIFVCLNQHNFYGNPSASLPTAFRFFGVPQQVTDLTQSTPFGQGSTPSPQPTIDWMLTNRLPPCPQKYNLYKMSLWIVYLV